VLDEPTEGLDAAARRRFWEMVARRRDRGTAVILTTHLIDEAAAVADRVVVLRGGEIIAEDHPTALTSRLRTRTVTVRTVLTVPQVAALPGAPVVTSDGDHLRVRTDHPERLLAALYDADPAYGDLRVEGASLEAAIVGLTDPIPEVAA
jgi:ABC-2 type transport system ATP-binding protein